MRYAICLVAGLLMFEGCGKRAGESQPQTGAPATVVGEEPASSGDKPEQVAAVPVSSSAAAPLTAEATEEPEREPATVEQAAAVLDLSKFPILPGAKEPGARRVASLGYAAAADLKEAFEFQRKALLERGFKELSPAQLYDQSASGSFGKNGFYISVSIYPAGEPGQVGVNLQNHGNLNLAKLPVPPGAKLSHAFPAVAGFTSGAPRDETAEAVRKLLLAQGWQPYGTAGDSMSFKKNAVELDARVSSHEAQPGKVFLDYTAHQMSADLPAPLDAERVQYADDNKRLDVDAVGTPDDVVAYYKKELGPGGWQPTTENRITDKNTSFMIFRNPAKDMLTLNMRDLGENKTRFDLSHQTAAEVEEVDRRIKLAIEERKRKEEEERNRPKPKVTIALPAGASSVEATAQEIEFQLPTGKAQEALDGLLQALKAEGWQAEQPVGQKEAGLLSLKKDGLEMSIQYVDPGFIPAQITITARGKLELERKP
jgi:hypothetical protein